MLLVDLAAGILVNYCCYYNHPEHGKGMKIVIFFLKRHLGQFS